MPTRKLPSRAVLLQRVRAIRSQKMPTLRTTGLMLIDKVSCGDVMFFLFLRSLDGRDPMEPETPVTVELHEQFDDPYRDPTATEHIIDFEARTIRLIAAHTMVIDAYGDETSIRVVAQAGERVFAPEWEAQYIAWAESILLGEVPKRPFA